jgi:hypothetical protein
VVTTGCVRTRAPIPKMPMARVDENAKAIAVQILMASVVSIEVRLLPVLLPSLPSSATSRLPLVQ